MSPSIEFDFDTPELSLLTSGNALVSRSIHSSGLRVLTEKVPGAHSTSLGFWIAVGSRDEDQVAYGSTHFLEHLLFKGTKARTALDIAVAFDSVGGEHNAMTAKEHTCYYAKVQDIDVPMAIDVLSDMLAGSLIDAAEFEVERQVILEELAMADDDPSDVAHERIAETVFGDHPLGRPIGGNPDTIKAATRESVVGHYRQYYQPSELVVTAAGALDHQDIYDRVIAGLTKAGWDLRVPAAPAPRRSRVAGPMTPLEPKRIIARPLEQAVVALATPGLVAMDDRRYAMAVLSSVLGGGMSSRLFQEIREKRGLAYSVYSYQSSYADAGLFGMAAGTSPQSAGLVASLLAEQLQLVAHKGITAQELARTAGNLAGSSALALESSETRMMRLGRSELTSGEFVDRDEALVRFSKVVESDVADLAAFLVAQPLSGVVVGNVSHGVLDKVVDSAAVS
jgi:predicted Zn-dependent peptidase